FWFIAHPWTKAVVRRPLVNSFKAATVIGHRRMCSIVMPRYSPITLTSELSTPVVEIRNKFRQSVSITNTSSSSDVASNSFRWRDSRRALFSTGTECGEGSATYEGAQPDGHPGFPTRLTDLGFARNRWKTRPAWIIVTSFSITGIYITTITG